MRRIDSIYVDKLYKLFYQSLCYYSFQIVGSSDIAKDIVQDVFIKVIENPPQSIELTYFKNFLYTLVRNHSINYIKSNQLHNQLNDKYYNENIIANADDDYIVQTEVLLKLKTEIDQLSPACRLVLKLGYVDGLDNRKIAELLGISVNTIRAHKMRGKALLKERLKRFIFLFLSQKKNK